MTRNASGNAIKNQSDLSEYLTSIVVAFDDGDEDDDEGDEGASGTDDDGDGEDGSEGEDGASGTDSGDIKDPDKKRLSDEAAASRVRAKKAEDALKEANARLKKIDDADKSELEVATAAVTEAQATIESQAAIIRANAIDLAFYKSGAAGMFKNAETARRLLDLSDLEVTDGKVDPDEIKKRAKARLKTEPYLAADGESGSGSDETGGGPNNGRRSKGDKASEAKLKAKYPALASRG